MRRREPCAWANIRCRPKERDDVRSSCCDCLSIGAGGHRRRRTRCGRAIVGELESQRRQLKLIASENYASPAVLLAMGNWLSDKYAEGTPGHRFYAGCEMVDRIETLAADHAKALFGAEHAYVQPHSGIDANLVAYWAILARRVERPSSTKRGGSCERPRLRELGPAAQRAALPAHDGYGPRRRRPSHPRVPAQHLREALRPDQLRGRPLLRAPRLRRHRRPGQEFRPLVLVAGYSAYPRNPNFATLAEIAHDVGATFMVDMAHFAGLVAGKVLTGDLDPVPHADVVTSTTHKSLRGPRGGLVLCTEEYAPYVDKGCPMVLGGPLPHVMAAKAIALSEARQPSFAAYATQIVGNARALADGLLRARSRSRHRGNRQPPRPHGRRHQLRPDRPPGRGRSARCGRGHQSQLGAR
jgi:glycine hydroxymethyltransferase